MGLISLCLRWYGIFFTSDELSSPDHINWAHLPRELLGLVLDNLVLLPDYIRFGAVCKGWRLAALDYHQDRLKTCYQQPPMILLPPEVGDEDHRRLYNICEGKIYPHPLTIPNTVKYLGSRFCGSSYGWLAFADGGDRTITLFNPFCGKTLLLLCPRYDVKSPLNFESDPVHTVTLSCDPCSNPKDWVAVAIYGLENRLAYTRAGKNSWYHAIDPVVHVIAAGFYHGQLYVMTRSYGYNGGGELFQIGIGEDETCWREDIWSVRSSSVKSVKQLTKLKGRCRKSYFVDFGEDLLLVRRHYGCGGKATKSFDVFKLFLKENHSGTIDSHYVAEWIEIQDLGGFSLFLGENKPICICAAIFRDCKPNCIYYTPDCRSLNDRSFYVGVFDYLHEGSSSKVEDVGVFDLATRRNGRFHTIPLLKKSMPSAVWFSPNLV